MKSFLLKDIVIVITWNSNAYVHTLLRSILLPRNSSVALHLEEHLAFVACIKHFDGAVQDSQSGSRTGKTILLFSVNSPPLLHIRCQLPLSGASRPLPRY